MNRTENDHLAPTTLNKAFRVVVLISGRGSNLRSLHSSLEADGLPIEIVAVLSDKKSARGLEFASEEGIPTRVVPRRAKERSNAEFNTALAEAAEEFKPDLVVLAGFMRIVTKEFISQFPNRIINIHPSLLPSFRGLDGQGQALTAGVKFAGCSVHYVREEVDAGPIIAQAVVPILSEDTDEMLNQRILAREHVILPAVVKAIAEGSISLVVENGCEKVRVNKERELCDSGDFMMSLA